MKTWKRAPSATYCGGCPNRVIEKGEPALYWQFRTVKRECIRCVDCAGEAPPDLPPLIERTFEPVCFTHVSQVLPQRTRGALKALTAEAPSRDEWMPCRD